MLFSESLSGLPNSFVLFVINQLFRLSFFNKNIYNHYVTVGKSIHRLILILLIKILLEAVIQLSTLSLNRFSSVAFLLVFYFKLFGASICLIRPRATLFWNSSVIFLFFVGLNLFYKTIYHLQIQIYFWLKSLSVCLFLPLLVIERLLMMLIGLFHKQLLILLLFNFRESFLIKWKAFFNH